VARIGGDWLRGVSVVLLSLPNQRISLFHTGTRIFPSRPPFVASYIVIAEVLARRLGLAHWDFYLSPLLCSVVKVMWKVAGRSLPCLNLEVVVEQTGESTPQFPPPPHNPPVFLHGPRCEKRLPRGFLELFGPPILLY